MLYPEKQWLYADFLDDWGDRFEKVPLILEHVARFPELREKLGKNPLLSAHELGTSQLEWVSLVAQFDSPIESVFFRPYWVPVIQDNYDYFIDLSSFSIFETRYLYVKTYRWRTEVIIPDASKFLLSADDPSFDIKNELSVKETAACKFGNLRFDERKVPSGIDWISRKEIAYYYQQPTADFCKIVPNGVELRHLGPLAIGFLPRLIDAYIYKVNNNELQKEINFAEVNTIGKFTTLLEYIGEENVHYFYIHLSEEERFHACFDDGVLTISHRPFVLKNLLTNLNICFDGCVGYDFASIHVNEHLGLNGIFLHSPLEERLIETFNYRPIANNSLKLYQAAWRIVDNKLELIYANGWLNGVNIYTSDIVPEYSEEEIFHHYRNFSGSILFVAQKIINLHSTEIGFRQGDILKLTIKKGMLIYL